MSAARLNNVKKYFGFPNDNNYQPRKERSAGVGDAPKNWGAEGLAEVCFRSWIQPAVASQGSCGIHLPL